MTHAAEPTPPADADADAVRADIEATRAELAQTVDALQDKLNVKARASAKASETAQKVAPYQKPVLAGALLAVVTLIVLRKRRSRS
ncbi:MAG TPA: DUF3618 domain-containing protein [Jatrophihabitans sp.]|jgi:hypothetical protein|uniref:DUF3618 domain-containing protein n=1 Tax=Jatrophihabitans sp. TaxID=1932789 RepID=UPI002E090C2D|nr:DUF3618 domain-containing protein [Jatrophihabitans sp.]